MGQPEGTEQFMQRCRWMADVLVERGFATRVLFDDNLESVQVTWTVKGAFLQNLLKDLFREAVPSDQTICQPDAVAALSLILKTKGISPELPS